MSDSRELVNLQLAIGMLARAESLEDVIKVRTIADAARIAAKDARAGLEIFNLAAEIKLRAERKAGEFLTSLKLRGGNRRANAKNYRPRLEDLGITAQESKRWQLVASVSEEVFCKYVAKKQKLGEEITSAGLYSIARELRHSNNHSEDKTSETHTNREIDKSTSESANADPHSLLSELKEHQALLARILKPIYAAHDKTNKVVFRCGEYQGIVHLLEELEQGLAELERML